MPSTAMLLCILLSNLLKQSSSKPPLASIVPCSTPVANPMSTDDDDLTRRIVWGGMGTDSLTMFEDIDRSMLQGIAFATRTRIMISDAWSDEDAPIYSSANAWLMVSGWRLGVGRNKKSLFTQSLATKELPPISSSMISFHSLPSPLPPLSAFSCA